MYVCILLCVYHAGELHGSTALLGYDAAPYFSVVGPSIWIAFPLDEHALC